MARLRTLKPRLQEFKGREIRSLPTPSEKRTKGRKRQDMRLRVWTKAMAICAGCGRTCDYDSWHMDHVIPLWKGGDDLESNMQGVTFTNVSRFVSRSQRMNSEVLAAQCL